MVAGYSLRGVLTRYLANAHEDDNETRFFSLNAFGSGNRDGLDVEAYCIQGNNKSNGKFFNPAPENSVILQSEFEEKHHLEAYLYV